MSSQRNGRPWKKRWRPPPINASPIPQHLLTSSAQLATPTHQSCKMTFASKGSPHSKVREGPFQQQPIIIQRSVNGLKNTAVHVNLSNSILFQYIKQGRRLLGSQGPSCRGTSQADALGVAHRAGSSSHIDFAPLSLPPSYEGRRHRHSALKSFQILSGVAQTPRQTATFARNQRGRRIVDNIQIE